MRAKRGMRKSWQSASIRGQAPETPSPRGPAAEQARACTKHRTRQNSCSQLPTATHNRAPSRKLVHGAEPLTCVATSMVYGMAEKFPGSAVVSTGREWQKARTAVVARSNGGRRSPDGAPRPRMRRASHFPKPHNECASRGRVRQWC